MVKFRFQDLKIWQLSIEIADELFDIGDGLEEKRLYRFAEQLRGAGNVNVKQYCGRFGIFFEERIQTILKCGAKIYFRKC